MRRGHRFPGYAMAGITACIAFCLPLAADERTPEPPPAGLVREAVDNEIAASSGAGVHFMFRDTRTTAHLSQTKLMVETRDATAGILIAEDGHPLTPQQQRAEEARLENYIRNPEELTKKRKQEKEEDDRTLRLLKALPDAFLYESAGTVSSSPGIGRMGHELVRLKFRPNPFYQPPSRVEQVLTAMQGTVLIDGQEKRIAVVDGTLEKEVGFGWGILGHLDRGGHFLVHQADVGDNCWELTRMELAFTGKVLLVKKLNIHSSDVFSDFRVVPSTLTFAEGVELLKKEMAKAQEASSSAARPSESKALPIGGHSGNHPKDSAETCLSCN
jgi:hypothetical protein